MTRIPQCGGEIAAVHAPSLVREIGIGIDANLATDLFPQPAKAVVFGKIPSRLGIDHHVKETVMHATCWIGALGPIGYVL